MVARSFAPHEVNAEAEAPVARGGATETMAFASSCTTSSSYAERDLEAIVTLMEVAALTLTDKPGATFTYGRLAEEVRTLCGDEVSVEPRDLRIVFETSRLFDKVPGGLRLR